MFQIEKIELALGGFIGPLRQAHPPRQRGLRFMLLSLAGEVGFRQRAMCQAWNCLACNSRR